MVKPKVRGHSWKRSFTSSTGNPGVRALGLTPQSVLRLGGYKVQGREERPASRLRDDALASAAGASLLV